MINAGLLKALVVPHLPRLWAMLDEAGPDEAGRVLAEGLAEFAKEHGRTDTVAQVLAATARHLGERPA